MEKNSGAALRRFFAICEKPVDEIKMTLPPPGRRLNKGFVPRRANVEGIWETILITVILLFPSPEGSAKLKEAGAFSAVFPAVLKMRAGLQARARILLHHKPSSLVLLLPK